MAKLRYWVQETSESGKWCFSEQMQEASVSALMQSGIYESASIVQDFELMECGTCAHSGIEECSLHGYEISDTGEACKDYEASGDY